MINVMPSDDLYSVVAFMVRPNTLTSALQVLRSVAIVGTWQNTGIESEMAASAGHNKKKNTVGSDFL